MTLKTLFRHALNGPVRVVPTPEARKRLRGFGVTKGGVVVGITNVVSDRTYSLKVKLHGRKTASPYWSGFWMVQS